MPRAIVRLSLDSDYGSANTNQIRVTLEAGGFVKIGTGSYEADEPTAQELLATLGRVVAYLQNLSGNATLDHLWIYVDVPHPGPALFQ